LTDDIKMLEQCNIELKEDKNRVTLQLEEMRSAFRNKLAKYMGDHDTKDSSAVTWSAKEEIIRSYTEKETDMAQRLEKEC